MPGSDGDAKSALQEWAQGQGLALPKYSEVVSRKGPDHAPHFTAEVRIYGQGARARRRRLQAHAEQAAASALLEREGVCEARAADD